MKLIVCGGRKYGNYFAVRHVLDTIHAKRPITLIIEGGAMGADRLARSWAIEHRIPYVTEEVTKADWDKYGRGAGPRRNGLMLKHKPDGVVAFPGNDGTADMMKQARQAGVTVYEPF
jgi:hypothetical protein